ncbi:uncharacterized protein CCOS01_01241 [Colletotrichum costaricense]|uniref:Uncharacterized protein n=1 Tax=Colletotrichum costaricense TaxID=1209916 RepID=A0AAJ0E6W1_9PEZI|nr:uncharacterized protein CCOS01_01241 [Colletotrichum costaricense]KAK1539927.1 hypothetical protein CCOS01_01241 [Colletotrichum costaricense]
MTSGKETSWERATHDVALDPCHFSPLSLALPCQKEGILPLPCSFFLPLLARGHPLHNFSLPLRAPGALFTAWPFRHSFPPGSPLQHPFTSRLDSITPNSARKKHQSTSRWSYTCIQSPPRSHSFSILLPWTPCSRRKILSARARRNLERLCPSEESKNTWDPGPNPRSTLYPIMTRPVGPVAQIHRHWFSSWSTMLRPSGQKLHDSS